MGKEEEGVVGVTMKNHHHQRAGRQRLSTHEPSESESIRSEGGTFELSTEEDNEELECAGVAFFRKTIERDAMSLPQYAGADLLLYVVRGEGRLGIVFPGCPETYREDEPSFQGRRSRRRSSERRGEEEDEDSSQKVRRIRRGDVIAIFAGAAYWSYNDGNEPLQIVAIADTSNPQNQNRRDYSSFPLAGPASSSGGGGRREEEGEEERGRRGVGNNILAGFNTRTLAQSLDVELETARRLQQNQHSRFFARVERGRRLSLPAPRSRSRSRSPYAGRQRQWGREDSENGVEELVCPMRVKHNADNPEDADVYVRDGGRMNIVNRYKLPALKYLGLGAERVILPGRASFVPSWRMNAHAIMYVTRGEGRIEVVGDEGRSVFDGRVKEGQFIVIPQFYAVVKQAGEDGLEYITFTTSDNSYRSTLAARQSVLKRCRGSVACGLQNRPKRSPSVMRNREHDTLILPPSSSLSGSGRYQDQQQNVTSLLVQVA
uniref:Pine globulin-1 n=1 Tax=Pinus strobus TaxID=3348 RepID=Q41017_PINST|nr:pine globulin-1 [Pinus strobus]